MQRIRLVRFPHIHQIRQRRQGDVGFHSIDLRAPTRRSIEPHECHFGHAPTGGILLGHLFAKVHQVLYGAESVGMRVPHDQGPPVILQRARQDFAAAGRMGTGENHQRLVPRDLVLLGCVRGDFSVAAFGLQ